MQKSTRPTHRQIAEQLGVSPQLVSSALRGNGRVAATTRQRILDVARTNGYDQYSNSAARAMASRRHGKKPKTGVLAVLFVAVEGQPLSTMPFYVPFFEGLQSEAFKDGLDLMLCPMRGQNLPRLVREGQVDGVVCLATDGLDIETLKSVEVPVVHIALTVSPLPQGDTPTLSADEHTGGVLVTRHLIELGHQRIAFIGFSNHSRTKTAKESQRFAGYCDALREANIPFDESLVESGMKNPGIQAGAEAMHALLQRSAEGATLPFTGLFCYNDLLAMGAIHTLQEAGFRVPEDVSVAGFDDVSYQYAFRPSLTSANFAREQMGRRAVRLLSDMETVDATSLRKHQEVFAVELIERESTRRLKAE